MFFRIEDLTTDSEKIITRSKYMLEAVGDIGKSLDLMDKKIARIDTFFDQFAELLDKSSQPSPYEIDDPDFVDDWGDDSLFDDTGKLSELTDE